MKPLDPNKPVQTREGLKAEIVYRELSGSFPILAVVTFKDGTKGARIHTAEGRYIINRESPYDLINVPEKHEAWVNVYSAVSFGSFYRTREQADVGAGMDRIACIKVSFTEGEGL